MTRCWWGGWHNNSGPALSHWLITHLAVKGYTIQLLNFKGFFIQHFVCKCSFREISMIKIVILDQSKPISLILKNKKSKICKLHVYYSKNGNKISTQPILKSNSTSFMFNNIFCKMNIKKVIHCGRGAGGMDEPS